MAKGYLGKISAIVSANTADFDGKLSRSAKEVSLFARNVQSNLTSASRQAAKSLEGIYTPLQRFERSLQAAATMKLSFKGFPGMIKDLDGLQQRLNSVLSQRQVGIVLKTTGMSSVSALRDAISGLKSKDVEIITRVGGIDKLKELGGRIEADVDIGQSRDRLAALTAAAEAAKAKVAAIGSGAVTVTVNAESVDSLRLKVDEARAAAGKLMGGEFMGDKSLSKAISGVSGELVRVEAELSRAAAAKRTLETMSSGSRSNPEELGAANARVSSLAGQKDVLEKRLADLEKHRDTIKRVMREIKQAEAVGATPAGVGDIAVAEKEKEAAIRAVTRATKELQKQIAVKYGVDIDLSSLNDLIARGEKAGSVIGTLGELAENLGQSDFDAAADRMRKLQSAASQVTGPLEAGVKKLGALGVEVAAAYHPALKGTQRSVEQLNEAIEKQVNPSPNLEKFLARVQSQVELTLRSFDRMAAVSQQIGQLKTGKEFVFEQPGLNEAINKGGDIGNRAAALPAEALRTNPAIAQSLVEIRRLADEAGVAYAKFLAVKDQKKPTGEAQKEVDAVVKKLLEAQAVAEKQIKVSLDTAEAESKATALKAKIAALKENVTFTVTGKVQNFDQARGELSRLQGELGKLDATQRAPIARKVVALGKLVEAGDVSSLETVRGLIQQIEKAVGRKLRINIDKAQAQKAAEELAASLAKFKESISFTVTGKVQNVEQARSELGRLQSDVDKLSESQKIAIAPKLQALGELVAGNQINDLEQVRKMIAEIAAQAGSDIKLNLDTAEAEAKANELKAKVVALKENVTFTVTGKVQNIDQARGELARLQGDLSKLDESQRRPIAGNIVKLGKLVEAGDVTSLDTIRKLISQIENTLGKKLSVNLRTDQAKKAADELSASLAKFKESISFTVTGKVQNVEQARSELGRLQSDVDKLSESQKIAIAPRLQALGELVAGNQINDLEQVRKLIAEIATQAGSDIKLNLDTAEADQKATALKEKIVALKQNVEFTVTGNVQNFDQARGEVSRLQSELGKLDATQRAPIARKVVALGKLVEAGDVSSLETVRGLIQQIEKAVGRKLRINLDKEQAQKAAEELAASLAKFKESISFTVTGKVQNVEQARSELGRLQSDVDKLSESQKIAIAPKLQALGELVAGNQINDLEQVRRLIAEIAANTGSVITLKLQKDEAEKAATELKARLDDLREGVKFNVTGSFSNASQIEAEVSSITADIAKLDAAQKVAFGKRTTLVIDLLGQNRIEDAADAVKNLRSDIDQQIELKVTTDAAQKAIDDLKTKMSQAREQTAFLVTGRPQNIEQADSRRASIDADVGTLDRSQRQNLKPLLEAADAARATGDVDKINDALDNLAFKVAQEKRVNVKTAEAKKNLDDLKATMDSLKDESNFVFSAKVQNAGQAEAEIKRIIGGLDQLDAAQQTALQPKVNAAIASLGMKDAKTGLPDIAAISAAVKDLDDEFQKQKVIKVNADEAKKKVDDLRSSLRSIADDMGDLGVPKVDKLRQAVEAARVAIEKMPAGALKDKLKDDLFQERARLYNISRPNAPEPDRITIDSMQGRVAAVAASAEAATPKKGAANPLGADFGTAERGYASLQANVMSLQSSLERLPLPMQTKFIPAINEVRDEFQKLTLSSTKDEIDAVANKAKTLEAAFTRAGQAAKFGGTLGEALNAAAITKTEKQLGFIRAKLLELGATASGPVANAFNAYSAAAEAAANDGVSGTAAVTKQLDGLIAKIGEALVAEGKLTAAQGKAFSKNVGDVGRAGADKFALAMNQAAFAVDDFMSSTGGLEFKLRAVSNNITQLAFILGGTKGLFIGLGAVIAGQAAVGLVKWANNGRSAEDQTKALNEALARQKGLVEELAQAFKSLGDSVAQGTRSAGADQGTNFGKQVSNIRNKQRELRENRIADLDPDIQRGRADRNKLTKQLESETDPGRRVTIQKSIQELDAADKRAKSVVGNKPVELGGAEFGTQGLSGILERSRRYLGSSVATRPMGTGQISTPDDLRRVLFDEGLRNIPNRNGSGGRELTQEEREDRARTMANRAGDDMASQRDAIERMIAGLRPATQDTFMGMQTAPAATASETIARLQSLLEQLEAPFQRAIDQLAINVATESEQAARAIRGAQEDVAQAIGRGVPGAAQFQRQLDALASELSDADAKLARAVEMATEVDDPVKREAVIKEAEEQVAGVRIKQAEAEAKAREVRLGRSFGGERTTSAINAMEGNERFKNERAGSIASARAAADAEMQARRVNDRQSSAVADRRQQLQDARSEVRKVQDAGGDTTAAEATVRKAEADLQLAEAASRAAGNSLELAQAASEAAAALLEAAAGIESALTRIRKVGDSALQRSEQGADAAQKAFEENPMRGGGREARDAAEERLINDRARVENAQADLSNRRSQIESDPRMVGINDELETITQRRKDLEAKRATSGGLNLAERDELGAAAKREIELIRQRELVARDLTADEQKQLDVINNRIAAREKELEVSRRRSEESQEFSRIRSQAEGTLGEASRRADEAQQRFVNNPTDENKQRRDEAEDNLRKRQSKLQQFQDKADLEKKQIEASPEFQQNNKELQQIAERRAKIAENSAGREMTPAEVNELTGQGGLLDREKELRGKNEGLMQQGLEPFRNGIDEAQRRDALLARADRGRDLGMTDRERFRKEFTEGAGADIDARAKEMRDKGEDPSKFLRQAFQNQMESVAPMLKGFQDERRTAALQGPSRAALNVSDVSTSQGASELTRLIRGDDSAKDVNLAELQKQSGFLEEIKNDLKANNPGVLL